MKHQIETLHGWLLVGVTCAAALAIATSAVLSICGVSHFGWWHLFSFALLYLFTKASLTDEQHAVLAGFKEKLKKKAALQVLKFSVLIRAVGRLRPLDRTKHNIQTEP
ncbi:MAG: hypothetical protein J5699_04635 [Bacteroidales bacterium]|nr:hypothetical protein [Bacteroidales bacterium]